MELMFSFQNQNVAPFILSESIIQRLTVNEDQVTNSPEICLKEHIMKCNDTFFQGRKRFQFIMSVNYCSFLESPENILGPKSHVSFSISETVSCLS